MQRCVFVHTNHRQMVGALVSQYSIRRNSAHADQFEVKIIHTKDHPFLAAREGQLYLRGGHKQQWLIDDLQSFTPLRFLAPELMGYEGRAIVIDPDVFAVGDIYELLTRDMQGKALMCRARKGPKGLASSVMLLDCAKLTHWRTAEQFDEMFAGQRDYMKWISLKLEPREHIGLFEPEWNDFDHLGANTRLLHNTKRWNQPWKTGLPVDFTPADNSVFAPLTWFRRARAALFGRYGMLGAYRPHPDPNQERFFFGLLEPEWNDFDHLGANTRLL
ncbi:MAG TPA: hypothetical protein VFR30_06615, partial [Lysobacter sp.]|nr:hypothetical protein [Lysobacter sp.]